MKGTFGAPFGMWFCGFKNERCVYGMYMVCFLLWPIERDNRHPFLTFFPSLPVGCIPLHFFGG